MFDDFFYPSSRNSHYGTGGFSDLFSREQQLRQREAELERERRRLARERAAAEERARVKAAREAEYNRRLAAAKRAEQERAAAAAQRRPSSRATSRTNNHSSTSSSNSATTPPTAAAGTVGGPPMPSRREAALYNRDNWRVVRDPWTGSPSYYKNIATGDTTRTLPDFDAYEEALAEARAAYELERKQAELDRQREALLRRQQQQQQRAQRTTSSTGTPLYDVPVGSDVDVEGYSTPDEPGYLDSDTLMTPVDEGLEGTPELYYDADEFIRPATAFQRPATSSSPTRIPVGGSRPASRTHQQHYNNKKASSSRPTTAPPTGPRRRAHSSPVDVETAKTAKASGGAKVSGSEPPKSKSSSSSSSKIRVAPTRDQAATTIQSLARGRAARREAARLRAHAAIETALANAMDVVDEYDHLLLSGRANSKTVRTYEQLLLKEILTLDNVETLGFDDVRSARKKAVSRIQRFLTSIDDYVAEGKAKAADAAGTAQTSASSSRANSRATSPAVAGGESADGDGDVAMTDAVGTDKSTASTTTTTTTSASPTAAPSSPSVAQGASTSAASPTTTTTTTTTTSVHSDDDRAVEDVDMADASDTGSDTADVASQGFRLSGRRRSERSTADDRIVVTDESVDCGSGGEGVGVDVDGDVVLAGPSQTAPAGSVEVETPRKRREGVEVYDADEIVSASGGSSDDDDDACCDDNSGCAQCGCASAPAGVLQTQQPHAHCSHSHDHDTEMEDVEVEALDSDEDGDGGGGRRSGGRGVDQGMLSDALASPLVAPLDPDGKLFAQVVTEPDGDVAMADASTNDSLSPTSGASSSRSGSDSTALSPAPKTVKPLGIDEPMEPIVEEPDDCMPTPRVDEPLDPLVEEPDDDDDVSTRHNNNNNSGDDEDDADSAYGATSDYESGDCAAFPCHVGVSGSASAPPTVDVPTTNTSASTSTSATSTSTAATMTRVTSGGKSGPGGVFKIKITSPPRKVRTDLPSTRVCGSGDCRSREECGKSGECGCGSSTESAHVQSARVEDCEGGDFDVRDEAAYAASRTLPDTPVTTPATPPPTPNQPLGDGEREESDCGDGGGRGGGGGYVEEWSSSAGSWDGCVDARLFGDLNESEGED